MEFNEHDVSAIACAVYVFPDEEKFLDKVIHYIYNYYTVLLNKYFIGMGRGECQIIKRDKFFQVGGYNENFIAGEDFDLYKRLAKQGKLVFRRDLIVYESPRRYRKFGYIKVLWDWAKNSVAVILANKSVSKRWEPVR